MEVRKIIVLIKFTLVYKEYNFQEVIGHMYRFAGGGWPHAHLRGDKLVSDCWQLPRHPRHPPQQ